MIVATTDVLLSFAFVTHRRRVSPHDTRGKSQGEGGLVDRALLYAAILGGVCSLGVLVVLANVPLAICSGAIVGSAALLRGLALWGRTSD